MIRNVVVENRTMEYIFNKFSSSDIEVDPVFQSNDFDVFGDVLREEHSPLLFEIRLPKQRRFRYCLVSPLEVLKNNDLLLKIKRYLIAHEHNNDYQKPVNVYFIGNLNNAIDIASTFSNQTIIYVTYEMIEQWYPKTIEEIFDVIIGYLLQSQKYAGQFFNFYSISDDVLFVDPSLDDNEKRTYKQFMVQSMKSEGLINTINGGFSIDTFTLTAKAISMHQKQIVANTNKDVFVALKFDSNGERIETICNAITESGFNPIVMNRVETNNWIMPEIFHHIQTCKFVVVDFSLPCDGAYYEAGYAAALNKPVIHLFDKRLENENNRLHFDIAQKSTIFYENYDDLKIRLVNRIKSTIE